MKNDTLRCSVVIYATGVQHAMIVLQSCYVHHCILFIAVSDLCLVYSIGQLSPVTKMLFTMNYNPIYRLSNVYMILILSLNITLGISPTENIGHAFKLAAHSKYCLINESNNFQILLILCV
jgi:hypothetical protein